MKTVRSPTDMRHSGDSRNGDDFLSKIVKLHQEQQQLVALESDDSVGYAEPASPAQCDIAAGIASSRFESSLPIRVIDLDRVATNLSKFRRLFPTATAFYTVRNRTDQKILETLSAAGVKFNCGTKAQIKHVKKADSQAEVVFGHPCKTRPNLSCAARAGVNVATFDSEADLVKIARSLGLETRCLLTLKTDYDKPLSVGTPIQKISDLLQKLKSIGLTFHGISFDVTTKPNSSPSTTAAEYKKWIAIAKSTMVMADAMGLGKQSSKALHIGTSCFKDLDQNSCLETACTSINTALGDYFPGHLEADGQIWIEGGHIFDQGCVDLATQVTAIDYGSADEITYFLNDSVYGSFGSGFDGFPDLGRNSAVLAVRFVGNSGEVDVDEVCALSAEPVLEVGDWVYWRGLGNVCLRETRGHVHYHCSAKAI